MTECGQQTFSCLTDRDCFKTLACLLPCGDDQTCTFKVLHPHPSLSYFDPSAPPTTRTRSSTRWLHAISTRPGVSSWRVSVRVCSWVSFSPQMRSRRPRVIWRNNLPWRSWLRSKYRELGTSSGIVQYSTVQSHFSFSYSSEDSIQSTTASLARSSHSDVTPLKPLSTLSWTIR